MCWTLPTSSSTSTPKRSCARASTPTSSRATCATASPVSRATTFNEIEKRIDIAVRFPEAERRDLAGVLTAPVTVAGGDMVPLKRFVTINEEQPVRELTRNNQRRMVTISGQIASGSIDDAWREANAVLAKWISPRTSRSCRAASVPK